MKNKKLYFFPFLIIILIACFLRFFKLSQVPAGFHVDESSLGYNAYSILKTGKDEWGERLPLYFHSFGEYRLPVYFYLTTASVLFFGLNEFSVRFWAALFGLMTIGISFLFVKRLALKKFDNKKANLIAFFSVLFLCFEPIHLTFSRIGIEVLPSLFFCLLGFYILSFDNNKTFLNKNNYLKIFSSFFCFVISIFSYHAAKGFIPLFLLSLLFLSAKKQKKQYLISLVLVLFLIFLTFAGKGMTRFKAVSIFNQQSGVNLVINEKINQDRLAKTPFVITKILHNKPVGYSLEFLKNYLSHFNADFLFFIGDQHDKRFSLPFIGNLLLFELPFFVLGLIYLFKKKWWYFIVWLVLGPVSAALSFLSPSSSRSIFILPAFQVISASGLVYFLDLFKQKFNKITIVIVLGFLFVLNIGLVINSYFIHQHIHQPYYRDYGFKEVVLKAKELEKDYDMIVVAKQESTYIHFLFFGKVEPFNIWGKIERWPADKFSFQPAKKIGKYYFDSSCPDLSTADNRILYICQNIIDKDEFKTIDKIDFKDGSPNFVIFNKTQ